MRAPPLHIHDTQSSLKVDFPRYYELVKQTIEDEFRKEPLYRNLSRLVIVVHESTHKMPEIYEHPSLEKLFHPIRRSKKYYINGAAYMGFIRIDLAQLYLRLTELWKDPFFYPRELTKDEKGRIIPQEIRSVMQHETIHLLHLRKTKAKHQYRQRKRQISYMFRGLRRKKEVDVKTLREALTGIYFMCWTEGIAEYFTLAYEGDIGRKKDFDTFYSEAYEMGRKLKGIFERVLSSQEDAGQLTNRDKRELNFYKDEYCYHIGLHVIFSILHFSPELEERVLDMDMYTTMRTYEKLMLKNNKTPVLGMSSGLSSHCVISYTDILSRIQKALRKR